MAIVQLSKFMQQNFIIDNLFAGSCIQPARCSRTEGTSGPSEYAQNVLGNTATQCKKIWRKNQSQEQESHAKENCIS